MMRTHHKVAGMLLEVNGTHMLSDMLRSELGEVSSDTNVHKKIDIGFYFSETNKQEIEYTHFSGRIQRDDHGNYCVKESGYSYTISQLFGGDCETKVTIMVDEPSFFLSVLRCLVNILLVLDYSPRSRIYQAIMSYNCFWYIIFCKLLYKKSAFIHGSIVSKNGESAIFTGSGGCGKTSTALSLLDSGRYKYVSEDFGIVDHEGCAFFSPKHVSIYHSDVSYGSQLLNQFIGSLSWMKKCLRKLHAMLGLNPRIKAPVKQIFSATQIQNLSRVKLLFFLTRSAIATSQLVEITKDQMVARLTLVARRENKRLFEILSIIEANHIGSATVPNTAVILELVRHNYHSILGTLDYHLVEIPSGDGPNEIIYSVKRYLDALGID